METELADRSMLDLAPGAVVITPVDPGTPSIVGSISSMTVGSVGLAVHVVARVRDTGSVASDRVWVTARENGHVLAFQAVARQVREGVLELSGVAAPVAEHRRALVRAATDLGVQLQVRGEDVLAGRTVDLSRGGCRIALADAEPPTVGTGVELRLTLENRTTVIETIVQRVEPASRQLVLTFCSVTPEEAARIDRHVMSLVVA